MNTAKPLTEKMQAALNQAVATGTVFTGKNFNGKGGYFTVSASTIKALANRGLLRLETDPDGDVMGRPV
jgi:hypothetical protein